MSPDDPVDKKFGVHPDVLKLGLVSLLTDLSSEMIFSVFAIFFTTIAGASAALLGMIEGFADLSASSLNYFAGWLSDRTGKRKIFALSGYDFSTLAKDDFADLQFNRGPQCAFASSSGWARDSAAHRAMPGFRQWLTKTPGDTHSGCTRLSTSPEPSLDL